MRRARDSAILRGADKEKAFYGVDQDAHAFANFIVEFLSRHNRWNSPKYLFGESYGTTRSAALANILENEKSLDLNGVILLSQFLNFDDSVDAPQFNPGVDMPYVLALPTYAATAWYHHKLPNQPATLEPLLKEVENFAVNEYAQALGRLELECGAQNRDRARSCTITPACRRLHRAGQSARQRRRIREDLLGAESPPAGSIPASRDRRSIR
jgi:carboxypeptidase C (cathepsin A)